ncbi:MAG: 50S ribosome-binding GTPase [Bacilli bacterium]|nr:50S ribosome-binding GTPase [Bacilli bacterium]
MKKCRGCGAVIQTESKDKEGYSINPDNDLCERCFRIKNYGDYKLVEKDNSSFLNILKKISDTNDLVVLVVDLFSISDRILDLTKYLNNDILLVLTKRDLLPLSLHDEKLLSYKNKLGINSVDEVIVSSNKNYNMDLLIDKINKYKKSSNVYVVGYTNAGKSTLINKLIYNYSDLECDITTSILPSTTLNTIDIKLNDELTLIDTPGILDSGNIFNFLNGKELKYITPSREIKPITYQIKNTQYIMIDKYAKVTTSDNNLTLFFANNLKIDRFYKDKETNLVKHSIKVDANMDIVISGLGFIKVTKKGIVDIYTLDGVDVYTRDSLI